MSGLTSKTMAAFSQGVRTNPSSTVPFDSDSMALYHDLVRNNLREAVRPCFPILNDIIPDARWDKLVADFLAHGQGNTPFYLELPGELVRWLKENPLPDYPFAADMAHYEWIELVVDLAPETAIPHTQAIDILKQTWNLAPAARLLMYEWPVENIDKDHLPQQPESSYLLVYKREGKVHFRKISEQSYQLLSIILAEQQSAAEILNELSQIYTGLDNKMLITSCHQLLILLYEEGILIPHDEE